MGDTVTITLPDGAGFVAERGENLLAAAQRAHWLVRYGCRNGNCEACAATLLQGRVRQREQIIDAAQQPVSILLCLCTADTDLHIELPGNPQHGSAEQARRCYVQCSAIALTDAGAWRLQFTLPAGRKPPVYAGQYLLLETAHGDVRAEIDSLASDGRTLVAHCTGALIAAGAYAHIRYPLGYCYRATAAPALLLADAGGALQARLLENALGDTVQVEASGDNIAAVRGSYSVVFACAAAERAYAWYQALLAQGVVFDEFRCDDAVWRRWRVQRQDDNNNRFEVAAGLSEDAARAMAEEMTRRGHKQLYWAEPIS